MKRFAAVVAMLGLGLPGAARAEDVRYPVDWAIAYCEANELGNTALAVSDFGGFWCAWDYPSMAEARREAVRGCRRNMPGKLARGANCAVIWENGAVTDEGRAAAMRKDVRMPVRIESRNGLTGEEQTLPGFITLGAAPDEVTRTARITLADGTPICIGAARVTRLTASFGFTATCFGDQVFEGEATVTGLVQVGGLNRLGFDLMIRNPPHSARIVTE
jgi:hypothetical protein